MAKVRIYLDRPGNTLTVWFDDPNKESLSEEVNDDVVLMKDKRGKVIGFERLLLCWPGWHACVYYSGRDFFASCEDFYARSFGSLSELAAKRLQAAS
jgi:uncharacterized protein YuzE